MTSPAGAGHGAGGLTGGRPGWKAGQQTVLRAYTCVINCGKMKMEQHMEHPRSLKITEEILNRVIYGMENQKVRLCLDPSDGQLKEKSQDNSDLISLPNWGPRDGYALMEAFTATLPPSALRGELEEVLSSGSGVFRRFKSVLKTYPAEERLWFRFKQREMRQTAVRMEGGRAGACAAEAPLGELAGAVCWETACSSSGESMQRGMIRLIYVRQEFRGLGIGSRLLQTALDTLERSEGYLSEYSGYANVFLAGTGRF